MSTNSVTGLHHITCIAGDAQQNLDFYTRRLGMRLVKKSVNQDSPDTYHLFYADGAGSPGTDLTFFPWPASGPGKKGTGLTVEVALAIPKGSLGYWQDRLKEIASAPVTRFGEQALPFDDPDGLNLVLVETADPRDFTPWAEGPVPAEHQIRGLHGARLWERNVEVTGAFLVDGLGMQKVGVEDGWHRYSTGPAASGRYVELREIPDGARGRWGTGIVHHVAWRVPDDPSELAVRMRVHHAGASPTEVIDRFWFHSVYFKEPGGVLFELATDGPGFAVDEKPEHLGQSLVLPPWLEQHRKEIEAGLPQLT
jgi:glyoxalase family protein